jgi:hypothetical protein
MVVRKHCKKIAMAFSFGFALVSFSVSVEAQEPQQKETMEPVYREAKLPVQEPSHVAALPATVAPKSIKPIVSGVGEPPAALPNATTATPHPLDRAIKTAYDGLENMHLNIRDYTATLVKRETVNGQTGEQEFMKIKVRNPRKTDKGNVPFSVYMKFLKPIAGREVIWVEGRHQGKLLVHEPGVVSGFKTFELDPDGALAMRGNRHPIYEAGLENLVKKLIEKAERDRKVGLCEVEYREGAKINGRSCTLIEVIHNERKEPFEFYKAQVFIDDEMQIPVRFASYNWPSREGAEPQLIEEYTYTKVELNVGLTDFDFDPSNKADNFPGR